MSFLTSWRLAVAADLLTDPSSTIGSAATQVGYANAFALSAAFKRVYGIAPTQYRRKRRPIRQSPDVLRHQSRHPQTNHWRAKECGS